MEYSQPLELDGLISEIHIFISGNLPPVWATLTEGIIVLAALLISYAAIALVLIYAERKVTAFFSGPPGSQPPW